MKKKGSCFCRALFAALAVSVSLVALAAAAGKFLSSSSSFEKDHRRRSAPKRDSGGAADDKLPPTCLPDLQAAVDEELVPTCTTTTSQQEKMTTTASVVDSDQTPSSLQQAPTTAAAAVSNVQPTFINNKKKIKRHRLSTACDKSSANHAGGCERHWTHPSLSSNDPDDASRTETAMDASTSHPAFRPKHQSTTLWQRRRAARGRRPIRSIGRGARQGDRRLEDEETTIEQQKSLSMPSTSTSVGAHRTTRELIGSYHTAPVAPSYYYTGYGKGGGGSSNRPVLPFAPGKLTVKENDLLLSQGLQSRVLAESGKYVKYTQGSTGGESKGVKFHDLPDAGACFRDERSWNRGGWIYVSNSEVYEKAHGGGVGGITFDKRGNVLHYQMLLTGTTANCGGGTTPWNTWLSCEETDGGRIWQVDPTGQRSPQLAKYLGANGPGNYESVACDNRQPGRVNKPYFYVTEDSEDGALQRFRPSGQDIDRSDRWTTLSGNTAPYGRTSYLVLFPNEKRYDWTDNEAEARRNAAQNYPYTEGIDRVGQYLYFVCKKMQMLFILDLDSRSYTTQSTRGGPFDGQPDQLQQILRGRRSDNNQGFEDDAASGVITSNSGMLFFSEENGSSPGVHGRDAATGQFFTLLEAAPKYSDDETTGMAFSPDAKHLYFCLQQSGICFDISRQDGLAFDNNAGVLDIKYHNKGH